MKLIKLLLHRLGCHVEGHVDWECPACIDAAVDE